MTEAEQHTVATEAAALGELFRRPVPEGKVRYWCDDGQDGGWIDSVTPEEAARRDALKLRAENGDHEAASEITWEEWNYNCW